jgi:AcrR family transcriptional regulator
MPRQARSRRTEAALLDALAALLETRDFNALAVEEITRRARVAVGTFYQRFRDKDAALVALFRRYEAQRTRLLGRVLAPPAEAPLPARALRLCSGIAVLFRRQRSVVRALLLRHWLRGPGSTGVALDQLAELYERAARMLADSPDLTQAASLPECRFAVALAVGLLRENLVLKHRGDPGRSTLSHAALAREAGRAVCGYLRHGATPRRAEDGR